MLASVLSSPLAIEVNIQIVRAFVQMRKFALTHKELAEQLLLMEQKYDQQFSDVYDAIRYLLEKDQQQTDQSERQTIGFRAS